MKKIFIALILSLFSITSMLAAGIGGRVIDNSTQKPLEFVTVAVYNPVTKKNVAGALTNENGVFNIAAVPNGKYELQISFVGYETHKQEITVGAENLTLGAISLKENVSELKEVQVVAQGMQMRFDIDKRVFSVDQNIAAAGGSATDVLQNIPSVEVDADGNVSLRNNESVEIWINGKPSGLTADNRAQILEQMPAENLESIEIMTNPSAKYNPEGTAGIINLVMKKNRRAGYYGSLSAGGMYSNGKFGPNFGANINHNAGKFDMFLNIGYRGMKRSGSGFTDRTNYLENGDSTLLSQQRTNDMVRGGTFIRAGLDYHINDKNTIGWSGMAHLGKPQQNSLTSYMLTDLTTGQLLRNYSRTNVGSHAHNAYNINLFHKLDFDKKGSNLMTNLIFSRNINLASQRYEQADNLVPANRQDITQTADGNGRSLEAKVDYTKKFTDNDRLELGWNSRVNDRLSLAEAFDHIQGQNIDAYYNKFDFTDQTHAIYGTYGTRINDISIQGGMRGEYYRGESTTTPTDAPQPIVNTYFQLFPSLYLSYSLPKNNELQFNYTRRINRPWGRQINSFRDYSDSTNISYGNPRLTPEFASVMELNYLKNWDNHTLSSSVYYRFTDDVIQRISFMRDGVMESTFMNLTKQKDTGIELVSRNKLFRFLNLTTSLNGYHSKIDSVTYYHPFDPTIEVGIPSRQSFSWNTRMIANLMFSPTFSAQITGMYRSSRLTAQGESYPGYSMDIGLRKTFFDRKLNLNLNVRDVLESRKFKNASWGDGFYQYSESNMGGRMIRLTASWNFGNMKPKNGRQERGEGMEMRDEMDMDGMMD